MICSKVNKKLYIISKLKQFGLLIEELIKVWKTILRPITEYAAPLWHPGLTDADSKKIETLQKKVVGMILGTLYIENRRYYKVDGFATTYEDTLQKYGLTTLHQRREVLTQKFATQTIMNSIHKNMFELRKKRTMDTRRNVIVEEIKCKNDRYYNSAIPYMARILNGVYIAENIDK